MQKPILKVYQGKGYTIWLDSNLMFWEKEIGSDVFVPKAYITASAVRESLSLGELKEISIKELIKPSPVILRTEENAEIYDACLDYVNLADKEDSTDDDFDDQKSYIFDELMKYMYGNNVEAMWNYVNKNR